jgi:DNA-binding response OmpR family regulator
MKILLVEDDRKIGKFVQNGFEEVGYPTIWVSSYTSGMDAFYEGTFDVVVLDLGLNDGDGLDLLSAWRKQKETTPVLILSARGDTNDKVQGLNLGADDYLSKPFSFAELLARVRSLGRRMAGAGKTVLAHGSLKLDLVSREVTIGSQALDLSPREFSLLELFLKNTGRVLTRTQIQESVWDVHFDMETNLLDVYISRLRSKLSGPDPVHITTVRGVGYRMDK